MKYEFDGQAYRDSSAHQKEWGTSIISEFAFKGNEQVLDLGCGDGILTAKIADVVPEGQVLGIDSSSSMIKTAGEIQRKNLKFELQDINHLDYHDKFDLIFSNAALHWVKDHNQLLGNCFKSLKNHGILRFNFAADGNCATFFKTVKWAIKLPEYRQFFNTFEWPWYMPTVNEYEKLLNNSPFKKFNVWGEIADRYFPDKEALIKWIDQPSLVPFLEYIPGPCKKDFRNLVIEKMIKETTRVDGTYFETFRRINLLAGKECF